MKIKTRFPARSRRAVYSAVAAAAMLAMGSAAQAVEIHYTHTGFGSGTLGGTAFGAVAPVAFTITAVGDTANIASCGGACLSNDNLSASISIAGVGSFDFITATRYFSNVGIVGFSRADFGVDLYNGPALAAWDMTSSVGPIVGTGELMQWGSGDGVIDTSGGVLTFSNGFSDATFTAAVVPEPSTVLLMGAGLFGLLAWSRRSARQPR